MRLRTELRLLRAYVAGSTLLLATLVLTGFGATRRLELDELTAHRITVLDSTGKTRVLIAGNIPPERRSTWAGLLFYTNEGKEAGGLIYTGKKEDGRVTAGGGLTIDQYGTDQIVTLDYSDERGRRQHGLTVSDRPDSTSDRVREFYRELNRISLPAGYTQATIDSAVQATRVRMGLTPSEFGVRRVFAGRDARRAATVTLADPQGIPRLRLTVDSAGTPSIVFLDSLGRTVREITP